MSKQFAVLTLAVALAAACEPTHLYVLQISNGPAIQAYRVGNNGSLTAIGAVNVPDGARGLAAF